MASKREYYLFIEEWNYPTESGVDSSIDPIENIDQKAALTYCVFKCNEEILNFAKLCGDSYRPAYIKQNEWEGYILTTKMGIDPYYYSICFKKMKSPITEMQIQVNQINELNSKFQKEENNG